MSVDTIQNIWGSKRFLGVGSRALIVALPFINFSSYADVLFSESFDDQPIWSPTTKGDRCPYVGHPGCVNLPPKWDFFHSHDLWFPGEVVGSEPSIQISEKEDRNGAGKALVIWDESNGSPGDWGSDGILAKDLGREYKELYVEFFVKFDPNYRWKSVEDGSGSNMMKLFRAMHYDAGPNQSVFGYFTNGFSAPIYILDLAIYNFSPTSSVVKAKSLIRCDEQATNYLCGDYQESRNDELEGRPTFAESLGDGSWHKYSIQLVMNSSPGVGDGVARVWIDNKLVTEMTDIPYRGIDSQNVEGWNTVAFGGNTHNYPEAEDKKFEQWYAIDEIKVYDRVSNAPEPPPSVSVTPE